MKKRDDEKELFEWEREEQRVYNRFKEKAYHIGAAIVILSALTAMNWILYLISKL